MYFCDICKVWMQDTKMAKLNHERGFKHKELLAKSAYITMRGPCCCGIALHCLEM